jgi:hypothetical protein
MRLHREQQSKKNENHREKNLKPLVIPNLRSAISIPTTICVNSLTIQTAHHLIDGGGGIENPTEFLAEFEVSLKDRPLPLRD